jgi:hypothetical protein
MNLFINVCGGGLGDWWVGRGRVRWRSVRGDVQILFYENISLCVPRVNDEQDFCVF